MRCQRVFLPWQRAHRIHFDDLVTHRVTRDIEPAPTAGTVPPAFKKQTLWVVAQKQVVGELGVADAVFGKGACDMRFSATGKFALLTRTTMWTIDNQHFPVSQPLLKTVCLKTMCLRSHT